MRRDLDHKSQTYKSLRARTEGCRSRKTGPLRSHGTRARPAARDWSADDLYRQVHRFKAMLDSPLAWGFLFHSMCNWIQIAQREATRCSTAVHCPRDKIVGTLESGDNKYRAYLRLRKAPK